MNINVMLLGQLLIVFSLINMLICFYLGRRKTDSSYLCGFLGFVFGLILPLGLIFLAILVLKEEDSTLEEISDR